MKSKKNLAFISYNIVLYLELANIIQLISSYSTNLFEATVEPISPLIHISLMLTLETRYPLNPIC